MRAFIASLLGVIAVGVLFIAYGLLAPRAGAPTMFRHLSIGAHVSAAGPSRAGRSVRG